MPEPEMKKPEPPVEGSCCKGGCYPCVWDYYQWALEDYEKQIAKDGTTASDTESYSDHESY